jgi:hypothetical protein
LVSATRPPPKRIVFRRGETAFPKVNMPVWERKKSRTLKVGQSNDSNFFV